MAKIFARLSLSHHLRSVRLLVRPQYKSKIQGGF